MLEETYLLLTLKKKVSIGDGKSDSGSANPQVFMGLEADLQKGR